MNNYGLPSQQEKQEMERLLRIMNGETLNESISANGNSSNMTSVSFAAQEDKQEMERLLRIMYSAEETPVPTQDVTKPTQQVESFSTQPSRTNLYENSTVTRTGNTFSVIALFTESKGKEIRRFHVVDEFRNDVVVNLFLKESAQIIKNYLSSGVSLSSNKIEKIKNLDETFHSSRLAASSHQKHYKRSKELGENEAANVFKKRFDVCMAEAVAAKEDLNSILETF